MRDADLVTIEPSGEAGKQGDAERPVKYTVLSTKAITTWAVLILVVGAGMATWLLLGFTGGDADANRAQLDAIRTAGTIVIGTGGGAALLLAARRQRTAEIALMQKDRDQAHQERVAGSTEHDAAARRITDMYSKAVEQLGSEKAPVRLGGLYALERVAQANESQRQTVVNVLCAYLRMPFNPMVESIAGPARRIGVRRPLAPATVRQHAATAATGRVAPDGDQLRQEREVRQAAQRILVNHLQAGPELDQPVETFWADINLDLTGATLIDFDFENAHVNSAMFRGVTFVGDAKFDQATFLKTAWFGVATFTADAWFRGTVFADSAGFRRTRFEQAVMFLSTQFTRSGGFEDTHFGSFAVFQYATFVGPAWFQGATFRMKPIMDGCQFKDRVPPELSSFGVG
jgi:hypothetical protein